MPAPPWLELERRPRLADGHGLLCSPVMSPGAAAWQAQVLSPCTAGKQLLCLPSPRPQWHTSHTPAGPGQAASRGGGLGQGAYGWILAHISPPGVQPARGGRPDAAGLPGLLPGQALGPQSDVAQLAGAVHHQGPLPKGHPRAPGLPGAGEGQGDGLLAPDFQTRVPL